MYSKPITLTPYQSAIFYLRIEFAEKFPEIRKKQSWRLDDIEKSTIYFKEGKITRMIPNPDYIPLTKEERTQKEKEKAEADRYENEWIYERLKKDYPNKDFAGKFYENYLKEYDELDIYLL